MTSVQELINEHKTTRDSKTQLELALLERRIWTESYPNIQRVGGTLVSKREYLAKELGVAPGLIENRANLLNYGGQENPLWKMVDTTLTVRTAIGYAKEAKARARDENIPWIEAIQNLLNEVTQLPQARRPGGKVIFQRPLSSLPRKPDRKTKRADTDPKAFWDALREMIADNFRAKMAGLDQGTVEKTWREFDVELKVVLGHFSDKISRLRSAHAANTRAASRGEVLQACRVLHIDPPKSGKAADDEWRKKEKKSFRNLASVYHPDRSGTEDTRELYEQVVAAHRILEEI
jgi:hypothetical protein